MLFEYAVEPKAIGSTWQNFRYLIEKFGFDRGRLISQFPKAWFREVYEASAAMKPVERKRLEESLNRAKQSKVIRSGRPYDPALGSWLQNAVIQHALAPFHAIVAEENSDSLGYVMVADEVDEAHPLMVSPRTWEVERVGLSLAGAMEPLLRSARTVLFVDRFFDIRNAHHNETLKACLDILSANGGAGVRCEIHFCDHDTRPPTEVVERSARHWLRDVIPDGMSIVLFSWAEKPGGEDFHARDLLTDRGGINVEAGFSADGAHQRVRMGLIDLTLCQAKLAALARGSTVYDLVEPVLEVFSDGSVRRI